MQARLVSEGVVPAEGNVDLCADLNSKSPALQAVMRLSLRRGEGNYKVISKKTGPLLNLHERWFGRFKSYRGSFSNGGGRLFLDL